MNFWYSDPSFGIDMITILEWIRISWYGNFSFIVGKFDALVVGIWDGSHDMNPWAT